MTNEELHAHFVYEDDTGYLRKLTGRKPYPWRFTGRGYLATDFDGKTYYLHRLVWQWFTGEEPEDMIDHRDNHPENCLFENLRLANNMQNQQNSKRKCVNRSGHKGVVFVAAAPARPWLAQIVVRGKKLGLGYHATPEAAAQAYAAGARLHFQEFARAD